MSTGTPNRLKSYITGFVLSLVCTVIPYYLVVTKAVTGNRLLGTIFGFAAVQLVIQVVFFLHLGRDKKSRWNAGFLVATIGAILVIVVGSVYIMNHLMSNMSATDVTNKIAAGEAVHQVGGQQAGTCPGGTGTIHVIELKDDAAIPSHTDAKLCDTIIITNEDTASRDIEFGEHDHHETYAGEMGKVLYSGRSLTLILTETGTHLIHDHTLDVLKGDFTVTP